MMRLCRPSVVVGVAALALAACSVSTDDDAAPATTETSTAQPSSTSTATTDTAASISVATTDAPTSVAPTTPPTTIPVRGVTAETIKLGIAPIDADAVREQFGVELGNLPEGAIEALVAATNEAGGINGRQIEVAIRPFLPVGTEPSETACRELVEDEQVYAVLGMFLGDNALCVTETYATPYFALFGLNDQRRERSEAPFIAMEGDNFDTTVAGILESGVLDGRRVAVYYESTEDATAIGERIVDPLRDAGVEIVSEAQLPASGDAVQAANDIDLIFQRFQADGADAMLALSGSAVVLPALERTGWQPQFVFTNGQFTGDGGLAGAGLTDFSELEGAVAFTGSLRSDDVAADPEFLDCVATVNEQTGSDYTTTDIYPVEIEPGSRRIGQLPGLCQLWDLTVTVLEAAGDDLSPDALGEALDRVGTFSLPGYPEASLAADRWGAVDAVRTWHFDTSSGAFVPVAD